MPYKNEKEAKEYRKRYYQKNRTKIIEYARKYELENRERVNEKKRKWVKKNKDKVRQSYIKYNNSKKRNPEKLKAYWAVHHAVRMGYIKKPLQCEECKKRFKYPRAIQAHHYKGYEKKYHLIIKWLCAKCHNKKHYVK